MRNLASAAYLCLRVAWARIRSMRTRSEELMAKYKVHFTHYHLFKKPKEIGIWTFRLRMFFLWNKSFEFWRHSNQIGITWRQAPAHIHKHTTGEYLQAGWRWSCYWVCVCVLQKHWHERERGRDPELITSCNVILVRFAPSGGQTLLLHHASEGGNRHMWFVLIFNIQTWGNSHFYSTILHNLSIPPVYNHKTMTLDFF